MLAQEDLQAIQQALHQGRITLLDAETGRLKELCAPCPNDGTLSYVYMITKEHGEISRVTFRCPQCGLRFTAEPERMQLH